MKLSFDKSSPFTVFFISDLFPDNFLQSLAREFPPSEFFQEDVKSKKRFGDHTQQVFEEFILNSLEYQLFIEKITSHNFVTSVLYTLSDVKELKFLKIHDSTISKKSSREFVIRKKSLFAKKFKITIGYEFSVMNHGSLLPPHTDSASKLLSIMVFLPSQSDIDNNLGNGSGTQFWMSKHGSNALSNWNSVSLNESDTKAFYETHECFLQSPFTINEHFGFCKSDVSWHSVQTVSEEFSRKSINITFWINELRQQKRQLS